MRLPHMRKVTGSIPGSGCSDMYCACGVQVGLLCNEWRVTAKKLPVKVMLWIHRH